MLLEIGKEPLGLMGFTFHLGILAFCLVFIYLSLYHER